MSSTTVTLVYDTMPSGTNQPLLNVYRSYAIIDSDGRRERISISRGEMLSQKMRRALPDTRLPDGRIGTVYVD